MSDFDIKVMSRIVALRDEGLSLRKTARRLEDEGLRPRNGRIAWHPEAIARLEDRARGIRPRAPGRARKPGTLHVPPESFRLATTITPAVGRLPEFAALGLNIDVQSVLAHALHLGLGVLEERTRPAAPDLSRA